MTDLTDVKTPFEFHSNYKKKPAGLDQWVMTCPFCEKEDHFFHGPPPEYFWDCKVCGKSGNLVSFLQQLYIEVGDNITKTAHFISELRKLPVAPVSRIGIKLNDMNNSYILPTYKMGKLNNLYKIVQIYDQKKGEFIWTIMVTPGTDHKLFNFEETYNDKIWIAEGHWDKIAGDTIISNRPISCIGVPGANVWDKSWTRVLSEKDVVFCYDNDAAGVQGMERVILKFIAEAPQKPKSVSFIKWPDDTPKGFDLNDSYRMWGKAAFGKLENMIQPFSTPEGTVIVKTTIETVVEDKSCDTFDKLIDLFKQVYYTTKDMEQALALVIASIYSVRHEGEQLWLRLIGPPGSGKTSIAKTVSGSDQVVLKSTFTGLFSGWKNEKGTDASLVPEIAGRTLIVKDADALLRQPNVEKIFSQLRDFYDKDSSVHYGNEVKLDYRGIKATMVLCGTNVLRRSDSSFLGERFLDFELRLTPDDIYKVSKKMASKSHEMMMSGSSVTPDIAVMAGAKGFLNHLLERPMDTIYDDYADDMVIRLANLAAQMRTKVDRDTFGKGEITFAPVQESPTRLIGQFSKAVHVLPVIFGTRDVDDRTLQILFKLTRDIIDPKSTRYRLAEWLIEGYYSLDDLTKASQIARATVQRELDNLRALEMVDHQSVSTGLAGRTLKKFTLKDHLKEGLILLDEKNG